MISSSDLQTLRDSFAATDGSLPVSLCGDFALLLGVSEVSICLFSTTDQITVCASSADVRMLDEWAFTFQEGPALGASTDSRYTVSDTARGGASQWPRLSAKADEMGYRSLASIPLRLGGHAFGTMKLHDREGIIETETLDDAERVAVELVELLVGLYRRQSPAIDSGVDRHEFHQATGMVMSQLGIAASAAAELLRTYAWAHDLTLHEVAHAVVSRRLDMRETPPEGG